MPRKPDPKTSAGKSTIHGFLPMTRVEMSGRGWDRLDVLIITGDAYVDHPSFGAAMIGRVLESEGLKVGVVAQPDWKRIDSIQMMGSPRLMVGVTAGNLDSMLSSALPSPPRSASIPSPPCST